MSRLTTPARRRARACVVGAVTVAAVALLPGGAALAAPSQAGCGSRTNNTYDKLLECVRVEGVREHQAALQAIADANGGNRFSGFAGLQRLRRLRGRDARGRRLRPRGPGVRLPRVRGRRPVGAPADRAERRSPMSRASTSGRSPRPTPATSPRRSRPSTCSSASGNTSTSGCEASDFAGFPAGNIALLQRGDVHVRDQGRERRGGRRRRDRDLQPGQHDRS